MPAGWHDAGGDDRGSGADGDAAGVGDAPKSRANRASLYTQMLMFTIVVVRNLAVSGKTAEKGLLRRVDETVSMTFAVR